MIYQIYISEAAEFDMKESYIWYENQQPKLGEFFKIQVMQLVETIKLNPLLFQIKYTIVRVAFYINSLLVFTMSLKVKVS